MEGWELYMESGIATSVVCEVAEFVLRDLSNLVVAIVSALWFCPSANITW